MDGGGQSTEAVHLNKKKFIDCRSHLLGKPVRKGLSATIALDCTKGCKDRNLRDLFYSPW